LKAINPTDKNKPNHFRVRFWGVRGSYPTAHASTLATGGNTSCVEVTAGSHRLIFDAGTGIIPLGKELCDGASSHPAAYIFLSHTHIDHVMGLCFFEPLLTAKAKSFIFGPGDNRGALTRSLQQLTHSHLFPVSLEQLKGEKEICSLAGGEVISFTSRSRRPSIHPKGSALEESLGQVNVATLKSPAHPRNGVMLYRVHHNGKTVVYATDIEQKEGGYPEIIEFARGTDLLIHDAQYLEEEYFSRSKSRKGWGHSTLERATELARKAAVKRLVLFHHEPTHDDNTIRRIESKAKRLFRSTIAAREGMEITVL
jgi:ribonuclease BN (tRNA processing enzyme)